MFHVFLIIQVLITIAMVGLILLQRSDSDGLSGLSGGGGGNSFMTGRAAANFLTRATSILATAFMINSLWLAIMSTSQTGGDSIADSIVNESKLPATSPLPVDAVPADHQNEEAPAADVTPVDGAAPTETTAPVQEAAPQEESKPSVPTPE